MNQQELIQQLIQGNESAYRACFNLFSDRVHNTALSILQNQQDAEDITQEVFIEVYRSIKSFRQEASLQTWIYTITTNKCNDHLKKQRSKKRFAFLTSIFGDDDALQHDKPHFDHPGVLLENKEHARVLFFALNKLPDKQKMAFTLSRIEGLSNKEAAAAMQTSVSAFESLLHRANENLKTTLSDYYKNNLQDGASFYKTFLLMLY
ncbi:MAG: RNA polymerase sigma factor [Bacteroidetes bacterium]|nr:MAG: RNA polymerase sigma factor [Bacteroidota bacterium]